MRKTLAPREEWLLLVHKFNLLKDPSDESTFLVIAIFGPMNSLAFIGVRLGASLNRRGELSHRHPPHIARPKPLPPRSNAAAYQKLEINFSIYIVLINNIIHPFFLYYTLHIRDPLGLYRIGMQRLGSGRIGILLILQGQSHCLLVPMRKHIGYRLGTNKWIGWQVRNLTPISIGL
ncbi:hypothetical protein CFP56_006661 [Quercus suber]|uniref:Uncharacterized protein n=1 Tax=Quercus suber TaxID=58331 RepID=A0AAW0L9M1_QUESU